MNEIEYRLGKDMKLNMDNNDIIFDNSDIVTTIDYEGIKQKLSNKLDSFPQTLYIDPKWGGLFQSNMGLNMNNKMLEKLKNVGKNELLEEIEVDSVPVFEVSMNPTLSRISIVARVKLRGDLDNNLIELQNKVKSLMENAQK